MKGIILAAGKGTRLAKYTKDAPKCMLYLDTETVIQRQLRLFRDLGINDISVVTGYLKDKINYPDVKYYDNPDYESTNMVHSLFCANNEFDEEIIISYGDIVVERRVLSGLVSAKGDCLVTVDLAWKSYWRQRFGRVDLDNESLKIGSHQLIEELGRSGPQLSDIDGRYVGLLKFTLSGLQTLAQIYHHAQEKYINSGWPQSGKSFPQGYMTDLINELIVTGHPVRAYCIKHGWLEFDTTTDYEHFHDIISFHPEIFDPNK